VGRRKEYKRERGESKPKEKDMKASVGATEGMSQRQGISKFSKYDNCRHRTSLAAPCAGWAGENRNCRMATRKKKISLSWGEGENVRILSLK